MSTKKKESRFKQYVQVCPDWATISEEFERFPEPVWRRDGDGDVFRQEWIFRGHKRANDPLEPLIERVYPYCDWAEAEYKILREFQSKAQMHMDPAQLPQTEQRLGWLATMQHYGAPTRLLDFTYSPYVALYFALRNREAGEATHAEVWGIDATALRAQAAKTSREADKKSREHDVEPPKHGKVSFRIEDAASSLQAVQKEEEHLDALITHALNPCGARREHFNHNGFVAVALPPVHNPRLSSQQGMFLFNGAEALPFEESLEYMMRGVERQWYTRIQVPEGALEKVERQLFQFNIHELSLFPDIGGLAGFIRQKIRLQW